MHVTLGSSTPLRVLVALALLGAVLTSPIRPSGARPTTPNFLRRHFARCEGRSAEARRPSAAAKAPARVRLRMIREAEEEAEGVRPGALASGPPIPVAPSTAPPGPIPSPPSSRPHLRC